MSGRAYWFLLPLALSSLASAGSAEDDPGLMAFNGACRTCHTIREGDNRLAPNLFGIIGRKAGAVDSYGGYTSAMQNAGLVWDETNLEAFIANPEAVVQGNSMKPYAGLTSADARAHIVRFLKACGDCGPTCPAPRMCSRP